MSITSCMADLRTVLEAEGFDRQVHEYGYDIISAIPEPVSLILKFGGTEEPGIEFDSYGSSRSNSWMLIVEVWAAVGTATAEEVQRRATDGVDSVILAIDKWPHLKRGASGNTLATVRRVSEIAEGLTQDEQVGWLTCSVAVLVRETETVVEGE